MGIPKFYRWLSERYPLLNQPVKMNGAPVLDNLYLDMNGIIHNCTHGNADDIGRIDEERMMLKIMQYIDTLMRIIKPQKLLYMAIDGVAPRAKMNQQRSRRFRSAKEASEALEKARRRGEPVPDEDQRFDSNCITPGTEFMANLTVHLKFMIRKKQTEDPLWQKPQIVFSGHEVPGEGEHKIMEHVRWAQLQEDYLPNQRHCLYGLDADLIMLALVSHEPHFCLLREVVQFGSGRGRPAREVMDNPAEDSFILFQIGMLRDYLDLEFHHALPGGWPFEYNQERLIDDFVMLCMLVGNDFLPPLPTLDIAEGALNTLFDCYKKLLPALGGYITDAGELHVGRLEKLLEQVGLKEAEVLEDRAKHAQDFAEKRRPADSFLEDELDEDDAMEVVIQALSGAVPGADSSGARPAQPELMNEDRRRMMLQGEGGVKAWRQSYYHDKLGVRVVDAASVRAVAAEYLQGVAWVLHYYYRGVASWTWFYPYHYSPMASDVRGLSDLKVDFHIGRPFLPFEQLLAVLPPASQRLLPPVCRALMLSAASPILDFYPIEFQQDHEGKRNDWEAVVLVPFIDERRLLDAVATLDASRFTAAERLRNSLGNVLTFHHDPEGQSIYPSSFPGTLPPIKPCKSICVEDPPKPELPANLPGFRARIIPGTAVGAGAPAGFPSLRTLAHTPRLYPAGVNVFGQPSKKESLVLSLKDSAEGDGCLTAETVAGAALGQRCHVHWPFLREALVVGVSDARTKVEGGTALSAACLGLPSSAASKQRAWQMSDHEVHEWRNLVARRTNEMLSKSGLDVGRTRLLLHVRELEALQMQSDGSLVKKWAEEETVHPLQATLQTNPSPDARLAERGVQSLADMYPEGSTAMCVSGTYYGQLVTVLAHQGERLVVAVPPPRNLQAVSQRILQGMSPRYMPSGQAARALKLTPKQLGMLTGSVKVRCEQETVDVGLNLKSGNRNLCIPDYTRPVQRADGNGSAWEYSEKAVQLLRGFLAAFPWVVGGLDSTRPDGEFSYNVASFIPDVSRAEAAAQLFKAKNWLSKHPAAKRPLVDGSAEVASEDAIRTLQASIPPPPAGLKPVVLENVSRELLVKPLDSGCDIVSSLACDCFSLGDRVVLMVAGPARPPVGRQGSVVGVHKGAVEVLFDEAFIGGSDLQGRCVGACGAFLKMPDVLNTTQFKAGPTHKLPKPQLSKQPNVWLQRKAGDRVSQPPRPSAALSEAFHAANRSQREASSEVRLTKPLPAVRSIGSVPLGNPGEDILRSLQRSSSQPGVTPASPDVTPNTSQVVAQPTPAFVSQEVTLEELMKSNAPAGQTAAVDSHEDPEAFWNMLAQHHYREAAAQGGWGDHAPTNGGQVPEEHNTDTTKTRRKKGKGADKKVADQKAATVAAKTASAVAHALSGLSVGQSTPAKAPLHNVEPTTDARSNGKGKKIKAAPVSHKGSKPGGVAIPTQESQVAEQEFWAMLASGK